MSDVATIAHRSADRRAAAQVIAFPGTARPCTLGADEPRGQILLFTGVRYERLTEPTGEAPTPRRKPSRRRRQA